MSFLKPKASNAPNMSENVNKDLIKNTYSGQMNQGVTGNNYLTSLLTGTGDTGAANAGYSNYLQMAGFAPAMRQLSQSITGQGAAAGILNSGSTAKALQSRGAELNQSFYNNYLQQLAGLSGLGLQAGGLVGQTGQRSYEGAKSPLDNTLGGVGKIASAVGGIASIFSDPRLKRDIELIEREPDGLGVYAFRYVMSKVRVLGVMADEVAKLRPWALGPVRAGYATVNYGAL